MSVVYNLVIITYTGIIHIFSLFNSKARLWVNGRKGWYRSLVNAGGSFKNVIWVHCASLGEFEQGRPVIEKIKADFPEKKILLTFFSPSGYEIRKDYPLADHVCYLPVDTPSNAKRFIEYVKPEIAIFVKYEFWNNYITCLNKNSIPVYLISAIFRNDQPFFSWYGDFFRKILLKFSHIFVQNKESVELLNSIGISSATIAGDTRFDRVTEIALRAKDIPLIEKFRGNEKILLAGSSWKKDEEIITRFINNDPLRMKWIFAPHEIDPENLGRLEKLFEHESVRFSQLESYQGDARILIIDNIGMLSSLYRYAYIAAVGGGFGKGVHNILEAAAWGIPVVFGPNHKKFREASDLVENGGARSFSDYKEFENIINIWLTVNKLYSDDALTAGRYVRERTGATDMIVNSIRSKVINSHSL